MSTLPESVETRPTASAEPLIEMRGIEKRFGNVLALRGVDFELLPGEVHGLLGQNGAGKSTLIKILAGVEAPSGGEMKVRGENVEFPNVAASRARGIAVVHQQLSLVPTLTVADNLFLGVESRRAGILLDRKSMLKQAKEFLDHYGIPLNPRQIVGNLTFAYRQLLEIAKALIQNAQILILDEPTSSLSKAEERILFHAVREVTQRGIGVIYVSHRLSEIMELTDRVTVYRDGLNAGGFVTSEIDIPTLVEVIVGHKPDQVGLTGFHPAALGGSVLELSEVKAASVHGAHLTLRRGEIVGLVGTMGSGRTEILESIFGMRPVTSGEIRFEGKPFRPKGPADAIRAGIKLVPEDRHLWGLVLAHSIEANNAMPILKQLRRFGLLFHQSESGRLAESMRQRLNVKASSPRVRVGNLSGGNQQKVVLGKWLNTSTEVLLLDEPTAGVDVGAREEIYDIIRGLAVDGSGVLVSSSDFDELMQICSRFIFVANGAISGTVDRAGVADEKDLHRHLEESRKGTDHDHHH